MRRKVLTAIGVIMLICLLTFGFFAFPIGISLCSIVGLVYGIKGKDKAFIKWSSLGLLTGMVLIIYTLIVINNM